MSFCVRVMLLYLSMRMSACQNADDCYQHYCGCPPFLANHDPNRSIHFSKYPYADHYAILGKAKELHCCFGGDFKTILWFKDDKPYPWLTPAKSSMPVLYAKNQSLILLEVTPADDGRYKCVGTDGKQSLEHVSLLKSFSLPAFRHPPVWKDEPQNLVISEDNEVILRCAATVGPQYDTFKMQPVRSNWQTLQGGNVQGNDVQIVRGQLDDGNVESVELQFRNVKVERSGKYVCTISNNYGTLKKTVQLKIVPKSGKSLNAIKDEDFVKKLEQIIENQFKLFSDYASTLKSNLDSMILAQEKLLKVLKGEE